MTYDNTSAQKRAWQESGHASLCLLGSYLQEQGFFHPLETRLHGHQKILKYTPVQKLEMLFISILAGAKAVSHTNFTLCPDPALYRAFGLPGCAEQSVIADTLDALTEADLRALREAMADLFAQYSQARRHDFHQALLILDIALSPLPTSRRAEGSERAYMGHSRTKTGRKLARIHRMVADLEDLLGNRHQAAWDRQRADELER